MFTILKYPQMVALWHRDGKNMSPIEAPRHVLPGRLDRQRLGRLGQLRRLASTSL